MVSERKKWRLVHSSYVVKAFKMSAAPYPMKNVLKDSGDILKDTSELDPKPKA